MKSKTTAAILAFLLGGIGVHKFYLGKTMQGLLYLVFCWTFIPAIIAFIEFILYLTMNEQEFNVKYNNGKNPQVSAIGAAEEIGKLNELREKGIITDAEFLERKSKL